MAAALGGTAAASTYDVGPGWPRASIGEVPWESLAPGDSVRIHWRSEPYREKWVLCRRGTASAPITVTGVPGPAGERPVVEGIGATTRLALDYWSETRGILKIGGASVPADTMPAYLVIENLEFRGARASYAFVDDAGATQAYAANASAIYIEKGENITIRNCAMHDCGNGFFVASSDAAPSRNILVEANHLYDNGNPNSAYEHNSYTAALGLIFQFNRYGPLRAGAIGNALKDRSAGLVVRYNWIDGGNRQLDLVNGEDSVLIRTDPSYATTHVYGNVLIERAGSDNRQIVHYGGDTGSSATWRKGMLHFYQNTVVSHRTDRTTLFRLSSNDERCDARNNVVHVTAAPGTTLALLDDTGILDWSRNWAKTGYVPAFFGLSGAVHDDGTTLTGAQPGFVDEPGEDFHPDPGSPCLDAAGALAPAVLPAHDVLLQYVRHQGGEARPADGAPDLGAFEADAGPPLPLSITTDALPAGAVGNPYSAALAAVGGVRPYGWAVLDGTLPPGLVLDGSTGVLEGIPAAEGSFSFWISVTDAQAPPGEATREFAVAIEPEPIDPVTIETTSLPNARRKKSYRQTLVASGGLPPYVWSITGALPPGLGVEAATGVISGTPTTAGTWSFTARAEDAQASPGADQATLSIRVR